MNGDEQERRAEGRERLEADRAGGLHEEDAPKTLPLAAFLENDVGEGAEVRELTGALGEQGERPAGVLTDGLAERRCRAPRHEPEQQQKATEKPSGHP